MTYTEIIAQIGEDRATEFWLSGELCTESEEIDETTVFDISPVELAALMAQATSTPPQSREAA